MPTASAARFDTPAWRSDRDAKLREWFLGDEAAVAAIQQLGDLSEVWDDLIDRDKPVGAEDINRALAGVMVDMPVNPWWQQWLPVMQPVLVMSINAWLDSEDMEVADDPRLRERAYFLKNLLLELVPMAAYCCGGWSHMRAVSMEMRQFFVNESLGEHLAEGNAP